MPSITIRPRFRSSARGKRQARRIVGRIQAVKEIFADQPARPKPIVDAAAPIPLNAAAAAATKHKAGGIETAAAGLIEAGVKFIESIASDGAGSRLEQILSGLCTRDARTDRPVLSIPLPESVSQERIARAISGLVNSLGRAVTLLDKA